MKMIAIWGKIKYEIVIYAVLAVQGSRVTIKGTARNRIKTLVSEDRHLAQRARRGSPVGQISNVTLGAYPE